MHSCCRCVVDEQAEDVFDGREFMNVPLVVRCSPCRSSETTASSTHTPFLVSSPASASASPPTTTTTTTTVDRPHPNSYARRSIVAKGQKRFEGISKIAPPQPSIERLSPRVINVLGMNPAPYTLNGTNCYVVGTGPKRILIDTGNPSAAELMFPFGRQDAHEVFVKNLAELMQEEQFDIELILLTHLHFDHFGGVRGLLQHFGADIPVGMLPAPTHHLSIFTMLEFEKRGLLEVLEKGPSPYQNGQWIMNIRDLLTEEDIPDWGDDNNDTLSWDIAGRSKVDMQLDYHYMKRHFAFYKAWYDETDTSITSRFLKHGEMIHTEGATLRVIFTPGHAENHASFVLDEEHSIFSGDNVLGYGTTQLSELYDYMATLEAMQKYKPNRLYPGHGGCIYDGTGLLDRYYEHRQSREDQVYDWLVLMQKKQTIVTAVDIASEFYINTPPKRMKMAIENIEKILLKLYRAGSCYVWQTVKGGTPGILPKYGYISNFDPKLGWELKSSQDQSQAVRHMKFVDILFNAMGTNELVDSFPKILEPEDILNGSVEGEEQRGDTEGGTSTSGPLKGGDSKL